MACFTPALGCAHSVVQGRSLTFVAHSVPDEWTPELWTNIDGAWRAIAFEAEPSGDVYTLELTFPQRTSNQEVEFTYRLSCGTDVWWFGSEQSNGRIRVVAPQKPFAKVHRFQVNEGLEQFFPIDLGDSKDFDAGLVWERTAWVWNTPRVLSGSVIESLSDRFESSFLILSNASQYRLFYALSTDAIVTSLIKRDGKLCARAQRDATTSNTALVVEVGDSCLRQATSKLIALAQESLSAQIGIAIPPAAQSSPRGLTWCTWNALGPNYKMSQVLDSLDRLKSHSSGQFANAIDTVVLDDGWQDVAAYEDTDGRSNEPLRGLKSFGVLPGWFDVKENSAKRGRELAEAVRLIKAKGVKRVGVWVTLHGYWQGFHPQFSDPEFECSVSPKTLRSQVYEQYGNGTWYLPDDVPRAIEAYYTTIANSGVDLIKIDDQAHQDFLEDHTLHRQLLDSAHDAAGRLFESTVHCMPASPRIYGGKLALLSPHANVIRNSDDFFPDVPDSHAPHLRFNALSATFSGRLVQKPDFDMCQADHEWGRAHVALRAYQTAPVWTTDSPQSEKASKGWAPLLGTTKTGQTNVLQASDLTGSILPSRIRSAPEDPLVVATKTRDGVSVSIFGLQGRKKVVLLRKELEYLLDPDQEYVLCNGSGTTQLSDRIAWAGDVDEKQVVTLTAAPVRKLGNEARYALLGLKDKIMPLNALRLDENGVRARSTSSSIPAPSSPPEFTHTSKKARVPIGDRPGTRLSTLVTALPRRSFSTSLLRSQTSALIHELKERPVLTLVAELRNLFIVSLAVVWVSWVRVLGRLRGSPRARSIGFARRASVQVENQMQESGDDEHRSGEKADIMFGAKYEGTYRIWTDRKLDKVLIDGREQESTKTVTTNEHVYEISVGRTSDDAKFTTDTNTNDDSWQISIFLEH